MHPNEVCASQSLDSQRIAREKHPRDSYSMFHIQHQGSGDNGGSCELASLFHW